MSEMLRCRTCGRVVAVRYPKSGDGSAVLAYRHPDLDGQPCEGSGAELAAAIVGRRRARPEPAPPSSSELDQGDEQKGPIQERTTGLWLKKRLLVGGTLYQLQFMRCGQKRCKRCHGEHNDPTRAHGPYWVAYTTKSARGGAPGRGGRWTLRYIGRDPSGEGPEFLEALARAR